MWDEFDLAPLLTTVSGPLRGATFRLRPGGWVIGRQDGSDIQIEDRKVSRRHAVVALVDGRVVLTDSCSTNGTWRNGRRISGPEVLTDGDRVRVGQTELRFFDPASARTEPVAVVGSVPLPAQRRATAAAPGTPTGPVTTHRPGRVLLMISGLLAVATWMTGVYLVLQ